MYVSNKSLGLLREDRCIYRFRGKFNQANNLCNTKHPVFIPNRQWVTQLIIMKAHKKIYHNSVAETLNEVRSRV